MPINRKAIATMDLDDLQEDYRALREELERRNEAMRMEKARELDDKAREMGFAGLQDAAKALAGRSVSRKVAPKFANPDNPNETWAGRGMKPKWLEAWLEKGGNLDDIRLPVPGQD